MTKLVVCKKCWRIDPLLQPLRRLHTSWNDVKLRQGIAETTGRRPVCSERNGRAGVARGGTSGLELEFNSRLSSKTTAKGRD